TPHSPPRLRQGPPRRRPEPAAPAALTPPAIRADSRRLRLMPPLSCPSSLRAFVPPCLVCEGHAFRPFVATLHSSHFTLHSAPGPIFLVGRNCANQRWTPPHTPAIIAAGRFDDRVFRVRDTSASAARLHSRLSLPPGPNGRPLSERPGKSM